MTEPAPVHCPRCAAERGVAIPATCPHREPLALADEARATGERLASEAAAAFGAASYHAHAAYVATLAAVPRRPGERTRRVYAAAGLAREADLALRCAAGAAGQARRAAALARQLLADARATLDGTLSTADAEAALDRLSE